MKKLSELLLSGEEIGLQLKPAERFNFLPSISCIAWAILAFVFGWNFVGALFVVLAVILLVVNQIKWANTLYVITNKRILKLHGVFNPVIKSAALDKIQNFEAKTFFQLWGAGHILFDTAGGPLKEITWTNVADPNGTYAKLSSFLHK